MEQYLQVGVITKPHGVMGEVNVFPTTDDPKRYKKLKEIIVKKGKIDETVHINSVKFFRNMVILSLEGYDSREKAETLREAQLFIDRKNAVKLNKDEYFIADLIDLKVIDTELSLEGQIKSVISTGANDVYEIELSDGRELLLPAIKECVLNVDFEEGVMYIHTLEGLL